MGNSLQLRQQVGNIDQTNIAEGALLQKQEDNPETSDYQILMKKILNGEISTDNFAREQTSKMWDIIEKENCLKRKADKGQSASQDYVRQKQQIDVKSVPTLTLDENSSLIKKRMSLKNKKRSLQTTLQNIQIEQGNNLLRQKRL